MRFALLLAPFFLSLSALQSAEPVFTVEHAIEAGLRHSTEIRLAQAKLREVYGTVTWRKSALYPRFKMGGVLIPPTVVFGGGIPIYSAKMAPSLQASRLAISAAQTNIRLAMLDLVYKTRLAYLDAQLAEKQIGAEGKNAEALEILGGQIEALSLAGQKGQFDVLATTVDRQTARLRVERSRFEAQRKRLDLLQIIGLTPDNPAFDLPLQSSFEEIPIPAGSLEELQTLALKKRIDLELLKTLLLTDEQQVLIAYAAYFPELGVLSYNRIEMQGPPFLDSLLEQSDPTRNPAQVEDNPFGESVSRNYLQLSWRVFDGFDTYGQVKRRRSLAERRRVLCDALEKRVAFQVMQALDARRGARELLASIDGLGDENPIESAREKLNAGYLSRLAFTDIVVQQSRFDFARDQVRYQIARASVQLQRALGLGVEFEDENASDPDAKP